MNRGKASHLFIKKLSILSETVAFSLGFLTIMVLMFLIMKL